MLKDFNDFLNRNSNILHQYCDKIIKIESFVDKEINDLVNLSGQIPPKTANKQALLDDFVNGFEVQNNGAITKMLKYLVQSEQILANAKTFVDSKNDTNNMLSGLKNSIIQNLTNYKEILEINIQRVRTKILKLNKIIRGLRNNDVELSKEKINFLINNETE